jgi:hypothetical protein
VRGRHLDVHDGDIGSPQLDSPQKLGRVLSLADDVEAGIGQQAREPLP